MQGSALHPPPRVFAARPLRVSDARAEVAIACEGGGWGGGGRSAWRTRVRFLVGREDGIGCGAGPGDDVDGFELQIDAGLAGDAKQAFVVGSVMRPAQRREVLHGVRAALADRIDVMDLEPAVVPAAGHRTAVLVARQDLALERARDLQADVLEFADQQLRIAEPLL